MSDIIQNIASNQFLVVKNPLQPRQELYISAADLNNDILSQDIVDALEAANDPSSTNPFATIADITGEDYTELDPVLSRSTQAAAVQTTGNRYIASANGATWIANNIYEWDGAAWIETVPVTDDIVDVIADGFYRRYTGTAWVQFGGVALLQGGNASSSVTFGSRSGGGVAYIRANNVNRVRVTNTQSNFTQPLYIGSLTATIDSSAVFQIDSTTRGILIPRVTQVQRDAFAAVKDGLLVFNSSTDEFNYNVNSSWRSISGYNYTEVSLSSAQILALFTTPVEVLPAPGVGNYYEVDKIIVEYNFVTTDYTYADSEFINIWTDTLSYANYGQFPGFLINDNASYTGKNRAVVVRPILSYQQLGGPFENASTVPIVGNERLVIQCPNANPTLGDGTLLVKIWYKIKTFGTEL